MKKALAGLTAATLVLTSCLKSKDTGTCRFNECALVAPATEIADVQSYLTSANITGAQQHCSGAFFKIETQGTGPLPTACNSVTANYQGFLVNGSRFDSSTASFALSSVIRGWTVLMPKVNAGGRIRMFIPPSLAYGNRANGPIPANSILIFDVNLIAVQ